ncbi:MAG: YcbK family protein [Methylococcales bacterium]|nr:YcbK family protein [Methylococcales bacterium]
MNQKTTTSEILLLEHELPANQHRRRFLKTLAGCAVAGGMAIPEAYAAKSRYPSHKALALANLHTGEKIKAVYFEHGRYLPDAIKEIEWLMRDYRTDQAHRIDRALLDQIHELKRRLGVSHKPVQILSGYRSPFTNKQLRKQSRGVAKNSLHMQGRAVDLQIEGVSVSRLRAAALTMRKGGVGYYPGSGFVHIDTGAVRTW